MAKEKFIDSITCTTLTAKIPVLGHKRFQKMNLFWKPFHAHNHGCCMCAWKCVLQLVFNCCHCTKVNQWTQRSLADMVAVSSKNNAALTGQIGGGLIGWLRGRTVIIRTCKSHAFSQIIPGLKAPIVPVGWCAAVWAPHRDNNATIHGHSLLPTGNFRCELAV